MEVDRDPQARDFWSECKRFFRTYDGCFKAMLREDHALQSCLRHLWHLSIEEEEEVKCLKTPTKRAENLLDKVQRERGNYYLLRQFLQWVCQYDCELQKTLREKNLALLENIGVGFQYSERIKVSDFPPDSATLRKIVEEFDHSVDNPFLPTWQDFALKCGMGLEEVNQCSRRPHPLRAVLDEQNPNVKLLLQTLQRLGLLALHEELKDDFNVFIDHDVERDQLAVPEPKNLIKAEHEPLLETLADKLSIDWPKFATYIGVDFNMQRKIKEDYHQTHTQAKNALREWKENMMYPRAEHLRYAMESSKKFSLIPLLRQHFPDLGNAERPLVGVS